MIFKQWYKIVLVLCLSCMATACAYSKTGDPDQSPSVRVSGTVDIGARYEK